MKKKFLIIAIILVLVIFFKYYTGEYSIRYSIGKYNIEEVNENNSMKFIIDKKYIYAFNSDRKIFKRRVKSINKDKINGYICLTPEINGYKSYTLCSKNKNVVSLEVARESFKEEKVNTDFKFNEINKNEYMLIWKYDGFYYLNNNEYKSINLFNNTRYSNDLMIRQDKYLVFPNYENEYQFDTFVILDMTSGKYNLIKTNYNINYDSYYAGNNKNNLYLFDNKNENLYEININKGRVSLVGNKLMGYVKYIGNNKVNAKIDEYLIDKISYFEKENKLFKVKDNLYYIDKFKVKFSNEEIKVIDNFDNTIYYIYKDNIYKFENNKSMFIAHYFELNFNNKVNVFVYKK